MKKQFLVILSLFFMTLVSKAIERPKITANRLLEIYPKDWYKEKAEKWKNYLLENSEDKMGWLEYLKVSQYAGFGQKEINDLANKIQEKFTGTYEAHFAKFKVNGWTLEGVEQLELALNKQTNPDKVSPEHIMLAETYFNTSKRKALCKLFFEKKAMYASLLNYSYNVLNSISDKGVLIIQGEPASIPIWLLQDVMGIKPNVKVLNLDLIQNQEYFAKWLSKNNLKGKELLNTSNYQQIIQQLPALNLDTDFFYGLTLPQNQISEIEEKLYVVGLASQYAQKSSTQYNLLKENIEQKFLLDYLTIDFNGEPKTSTGRVYETNYILPLFLLKEYYDNLGNKEQSEKWERMILTLAERSEIKDRVALLLEGKKEKPIKNFKIIEFDVKELDKKFRQVKGKLYASAFELTNKEYWFFLDYLYQNKQTDLYNKCKVNLDKYDDLKKALLENYHYSPTNMKVLKNPKVKTDFFQNYPAIDITYEAAKSYCEWITQQYNQQKDRKFKKVRFRLPSQKEWTMTALGFKEFTSWDLKENTVKVYESRKSKNFKEYNLKDYDVKYPWGMIDFFEGGKIRNSLDCYLANVKTPQEIRCPNGIKGDGFTFTSPNGRYFANDMGIFDVVGNVAEMIDEDGKAMGGSWNHLPEECTITSVNLYNGSDTTVGFRLFMEVIEE